MKHANARIDATFTAIALALTVAWLVAFATSCQFTPEEAATRDEITALHDEITADGIVTPEELARLEAALKEAEPTINWTELAGASIASILLSIFGVNAVRNRNLPGTSRKPKS